MRDGNLGANFPSSSYQIFHAGGPRDSGRGGGDPRARELQGPHNTGIRKVNNKYKHINLYIQNEPEHSI